MFDFKSIQDFDKHINLSIPNYKNLSNVFSGITCAFAQPESSVVDIGCSTGRFLSSLPKTKNCKYIGIDESVLQNSFNNFEIIQADIEKERVLAKIKEIINNGAVFLVAEKVYLDDPVIQTLVHKMHIQEKRKSFTDKDILNKDTQLAVSMFCKTETQLTKELNKIGNVSKVWQSYNFMGFCVKT